MVGAAIAANTRGETSLGPGPSKTRLGAKNELGNLLMGGQC